MKEPVSIAVATGAIGGASLGSVLGIPVDSLIAGLAGGLVAVLALPTPRPNPEAPPKQGPALYLTLAGTVLVSVLVAGYLGPIFAAVLDMPNVPDALELRGISFLMGAGAQAGLLVTAVEAMRRRIEQLGGQST